MEPYRHISRSPRSFNSKIGVPLSLWNITENTDIALIEAGISKKGEMESLSGLISPDTIIFTNIGDAHSEGFASEEEKAKEKCKLAFGKNVKTVIFPYDSEPLRKNLADLPENVRLIFWSQINPEVPLFLNYSDGVLKWKWENEIHFVNFKAEKEFEIENIGNAIAFMLSEGLSPEIINHRIGDYFHIKTRMDVSDGINGCTVIMDPYTSDISSLLPSLDFLSRRKMPAQSAVLIISDLHLEGKIEPETYKELSEVVKEDGISRFIGVGNIISKYKELFPCDSLFFDKTEDLLQQLSASDFNDEIILIKGGPEFGFERIYKELEAKKHETVLEVNLDALLRNYNYFRSKVPLTTGMIAMVKASGYGSGSYEIAKTLQDAGASYLAVAALDEGIDLRKKGIVMPIMVMNPRSANYPVLFKNNLEPVVYSISLLKNLVKAADKYGIKEYPVHIKLDTGMHRMGFENEELEELITILSKTERIMVKTVFSHLATADCEDMDEYTLQQLGRFDNMSTRIQTALPYPIKRHILNSAGILRFPEYHYDYVRLGIGLYGAFPLSKSHENPLSTVSTLRTVVINIRKVKPGEAVGYGRKGEIKEERTIATLPVGYADGINRHLGNGNLKVWINGREVPTIGNICMDAMMIDVTGTECEEGDFVEIFGEKMSVERISDTLDTIPYEILTSVSPRVKRVYYRE